MDSPLKTLVRLFKPASGEMTEDRRRHDRTRRAAWSGSMSAISTGLGLAVSFISIPLTVGYLGEARYGVWITLSSLLSWIAITDMGLGSVALINTLSEARGRDDERLMRSLVSASFFSLLALAAILAGLFALSLHWVSWEDLLNAKTVMDAQELRLAVIIAFMSFALLFPLGLCNAVYAGYQESYIAHAWNAVAQLATLLALVVVSFFKGGLPLLVLALTGARGLVLGLNSCHLFFIRHPEVRPSWRAATLPCFRRLIGLGWKYLVQQIANIGMFQSQPLLITQFLGPTPVGIYNVAFKVLSIPQVLAGFFIMPLLPAYGEARARNDWPWIWKTLRRSLLLSLGVGLLTVLPLALLAQPLTRAWISPALVPPAGLILLLAAYTLLTTAVAPVAVFFNGIERVGSMAVIGILNAVVTIALAIVLLPTYGLAGMGAAMVAGYTLTNVACQFGLLWKLREQHRIQEVV